MFFLISAFKIIFLLGFLIAIHETGHFLVAKLCGVRVNEFAIGFGPEIFHKDGKETKYALRLIPLGGFVSMEGEEQKSDKEGSFSEASTKKRIAIVAAGAVVNIIFAIILFFILAITIQGNLTFSERLKFGIDNTAEFVKTMGESIRMLFTNKVTVNDFVGPVGISEVVAKTNGLRDFIYIFSVISMSLGVTNLLPFPPLDGGKIVLLILEAIRKKPLKQETEMKIQMAGFTLLILLSLFVTFNDISRII